MSCFPPNPSAILIGIPVGGVIKKGTMVANVSLWRPLVKTKEK